MKLIEKYILFESLFTVGDLKLITTVDDFFYDFIFLYVQPDLLNLTNNLYLL